MVSNAEHSQALKASCCYIPELKQRDAVAAVSFDAVEQHMLQPTSWDTQRGSADDHERYSREKRARQEVDV